MQNNILDIIAESIVDHIYNNKLLKENYYNNDFDISFVESIAFYKEFIDADEDDPDDEGYWKFDITCYDMDGNICLEEYDLDYETMEEYIGEKNAQYVLNSDVNKDSFYNEQLNTKPSNLNDVDEVNAFAKKCFPVTEYYAGERGYILTDGSFIYFGPNMDHVSITRIDGMTVGKFVSLGNIRVGNNSFELEKLPTMAQKRQLYKLIADSNEVYVDVCEYGGSGQYSHSIDGTRFNGGDPQFILNQVARCINDGIKMNPNNYYDESKENKIKNIIREAVESFFGRTLPD